MKKILTLVFALATFQATQAQKIQWETGSLKVLSGQKSVATLIVYSDNMQVADMPEKTFLEERRKKDNEDKAGAGDAFFESWENAKKDKYAKRFNEHFTKASKEKITASTENAEAQYIILLMPNNIDLGKGRYFGTKPALVDFEIVIAENNNRSNIVAKGTVKGVKGESKAPKGSGWIPGGAATAIDVANRVQNFDPTKRIAESFELLAVTLGKSLRK